MLTLLSKEGILDKLSLLEESNNREDDPIFKEILQAIKIKRQIESDGSTIDDKWCCRSAYCKQVLNNTIVQPSGEKQ